MGACVQKYYDRDVLLSCLYRGKYYVHVEYGLFIYPAIRPDFAGRSGVRCCYVKQPLMRLLLRARTQFAQAY